MRKPRYARLMVPGLVALTCATLVTWLLTLPANVTALTSSSVNASVTAFVPPPSKTPLPTATESVEPTDTPKPTDTPAKPTNTPAKPTNTPVKSTNTPVKPSPTAAKPTAGPQKTPRPDPNCQSVVEGDVLNAAGQGVTGATVRIGGEGWSRAMLTDDNGHYGFGGLCPGTATLSATLPDGRTTSSAAVTLDGKKHFQVNLSLRATGASTPASATDTAAQSTATPEPNMPTTGYSGWLLIGGALMGIMLLLLAGVRRAFTIREQSDDQE